MAAPLYGLILVGGKSSRMGQDKAALDFHGMHQSEFCRSLLEPLCETVFLSNRAEQQDWPGHIGLPQIHDRYEGIGPMGGLLSAMEAHPKAAWLVVACDMPFLTPRALQKLVAARVSGALAVTYQSGMEEPESRIEPLCTLYEARIAEVLQANHRENRTGLRHILAELQAEDRIQTILADNERSLLSINLLSEWDQARALMG